MARLQSEFCTKDIFRATNFHTKNAPKFSPKFLSLCSVGQKKIPGKFPPNFPQFFPNFPVKNQKKKSPTSFCRNAGRILGPFRGLGIRVDPSFQQFGVSETPSQGPLRALERLPENRRGSSGASERGVHCQRSRKTRWTSQRPPEIGCTRRGSYSPKGRVSAF